MLVAGLLLKTEGKLVSSLSWRLIDGAGLVLCEEKDDRRFIQPELVLESLLSVVLLLVDVRGRNIDRRDLELSLEEGTSLVNSSRPGPDAKSRGADHMRCEYEDWTGRSAGSWANKGVVGCETLRRCSDGAVQPVLEEPGLFRLPVLRMWVWDSNCSVPKARPAAAAPTVPRAHS